MSWVFLTDDRVYKLKKPVKYPFLDFSTLRRRRFFCEEELRLNRRLANDTYRDVVPLRCGRAGRLTLSDRGKIIEWLVEMKRLPLADMLDARLDRGIVTREDVRRIGELLVGVHRAGGPGQGGQDGGQQERAPHDSLRSWSISGPILLVQISRVIGPTWR